MNKKAVCINNSGFNFVTQGAEYEIIGETRSFIYIVNDHGIEKRYGKDRFKILDEEKIVKKEKPVVEKKKKVVCKIPRYQTLSFNVEYEVLKEEGDKYLVVGDNGEQTLVLKKRFKE